MAKSVNKVILVGNLGKDPELKHTSSGTAVATMTVATNERFKDKSGEWQDKTEWHNVVLWQRLAEIAAEYLKKGRSVYVEGRLQVREYEDKDGNERTSVEVVAGKVRFLGRGNNNGDEKRSTPGQPRAKTEQPSASPGEFDQSGADDVPF